MSNGNMQGYILTAAFAAITGMAVLIGYIVRKLFDTSQKQATDVLRAYMENTAASTAAVAEIGAAMRALSEEFKGHSRIANKQAQIMCKGIDALLARANRLNGGAHPG